VDAPKDPVNYIVNKVTQKENS